MLSSVLMGRPKPQEHKFHETGKKVKIMMFPSPAVSTPFQKEPAQKGTISQHIRGLGLQSGEMLLNAMNTQGRQDVGFRLRLFSCLYCEPLKTSSIFSPYLWITPFLNN